MKKLLVAVPFTGVSYVVVEVEDDATKQDIINTAFESKELTLEDDSDFEYEYHERICKGNVLYAQQNIISWQEVE